MGIEVRDVEQRDIPFLWEMLYQSMYVPEGNKPFPRELVREPFIAKYIDGWGRIGDLGFIAEEHGESVGAVWLRLFDATNQGFGYVDDTTPELGIAIVPDNRGRGIGSRLMRAIEDRARAYGYRTISLSVDPRNPARRLYERFRYVQVGGCDTSWTMKKDLE